MDKTDIDYINAELKSKDWIRLTSEVSDQPNPTLHKGQLEIDTVKGTLCFDIEISPDFPLAGMTFVCTSHKGYGHMMHYGHLCLNTPPAVGISNRLKLEIEKLELWVQKYFVNEEVDPHFEYYHFATQQNMTVVFEETVDKPKVVDECGKFTYSKLNHFTLDKMTSRAWLALDLGGRKCRWTKGFLAKLADNYAGLWIKLRQHPVTARRQSIEHWKDLLPLLTAKQSKFLNDSVRTLKGSSAYNHCFILMIGYDIPSGSSTEVHWDSVVIPYDRFPFATVKTAPGVYGPEDLGYSMSWGRSSNASYERMFGRGRLCDMLTEKKILIIGTGAIGSQLFLTLVRGGCKHITINEHDIIEPGNVCRGQFSFTKTLHPKVAELYNAALNISPHVNLGIETGMNPIPETNVNYASQQKHLQEFDYIFDCSTDKYVAIMLDKMQLPGQVINFSISNEANHMCVLTGVGNIHLIKSALYDRIAPAHSEPFFVATGCWHPTFKASYADINVLLSFTVNEINHRLNNQQPIQSFLIEKGLTTTGSLKYEVTYHI